MKLYKTQFLLACLVLFEKKLGEVYSQYVTCLSEMLVAGEGDDILSYKREWMEEVNRGGLFPVSDNTFHLFIQMEKCVRIHLPEYLRSKPKGSFQQRVHDKIIDNEDVQFYWVLLSQDIENSDDSLTLLTEIVKLCVMIRGLRHGWKFIKTERIKTHQSQQV